MNQDDQNEDMYKDANDMVQAMFESLSNTIYCTKQCDILKDLRSEELSTENMECLSKLNRHLRRK